MPKVSVIIPSFNHESFLSRRIDSVLNQTCDNWELIILDDASTDGSRNIIESYSNKHSKIKTVFNDKNSGGPFHQWNLGAQMASGDYLWFAESDDYCEKDFLEKLVPLLDQNHEVGICYAQSYLIDEQDQIINSYEKNLAFIYKTDTWKNDFVKPGREACREWLLYHNPIPNASGALLRKSVYMQCGMADPDMILNGDWYLYTRMLCQSDLAFKSDHLNYFRVHPSTQREKSRSTARVYVEIRKIQEFIHTHIPEVEKDVNAAIKKVSTWWQGNLYYQKRTKENRRMNRELFRYYSNYRKNLRLHIIYTFIVEIARDIMQRLGLLKPAKKLRSILFPGKYFEG